MTVKLLFFGELKARFGLDQTQLQLQSDSRVGDLLRHIVPIRAGQRDQNDVLLYAVNQCQVQADHVVKDGDEVAFMPPMSGG